MGNEIDNVKAQLMRDREYWKLKYEQAVRNAQTELQDAKDGYLTRLSELVQEHGATIKRLNIKFDENSDLVRERDALIEANDGLEDTITGLRGALKAYQEQYSRDQRNKAKLIEIGNIAGGAL